jgi:hypothetical protein
MATESKFSATFTSLITRPFIVQVSDPAPDRFYDIVYDIEQLYVFKPVLVDGRMQMYGERSRHTPTRERTHGIVLNVYAQVSGWKEPKYECVRSETVPFGTSREEQERVLQAMCDIYATKEQAAYRLVCPWKGLHEIKQHLRPEKARW